MTSFTMAEASRYVAILSARSGAAGGGRWKEPRSRSEEGAARGDLRDPSSPARFDRALASVRARCRQAEAREWRRDARGPSPRSFRLPRHTAEARWRSDAIHGY